MGALPSSHTWERRTQGEAGGSHPSGPLEGLEPHRLGQVRTGPGPGGDWGRQEEDLVSVLSHSQQSCVVGLACYNREPEDKQKKNKASSYIRC